jgi:hypothetical protein
MELVGVLRKATPALRKSGDVFTVGISVPYAIDRKELLIDLFSREVDVEVILGGGLVARMSGIVTKVRPVKQEGVKRIEVEVTVPLSEVRADKIVAVFGEEILMRIESEQEEDLFREPTTGTAGSTGTWR